MKVRTIFLIEFVLTLGIIWATANIAEVQENFRLRQEAHVEKCMFHEKLTCTMHLPE